MFNRSRSNEWPTSALSWEKCAAHNTRDTILHTEPLQYHHNSPSTNDPHPTNIGNAEFLSERASEVSRLSVTFFDSWQFEQKITLLKMASLVAFIRLNLRILSRTQCSRAKLSLRENITGSPHPSQLSGFRSSFDQSVVLILQLE
jgi:hypothetical protein